MKISANFILQANVESAEILYETKGRKKKIVEVRGYTNPFSEPVLVYSNVVGGMGIWSSQSASQAKIILGTYPMEGKTDMGAKECYRQRNAGGYSG